MSRTETIARVFERLLLALTVAFLTMMGTAVGSAYLSQREVTSTRTVYGPLVDTAQALRISLADTQASFRGYAVMRDPVFLADYRRGVARSRVLQADLDRRGAGVADPARLRAVSEDTQAWVRLSEQVVAQTQAGGRPDLSRTAPAFRRLTASHQALMTGLSDQREQHRRRDRDVMAAGLYVNLGVTLVAVALVAWALRALREHLARPLARLARAVRDQESGMAARRTEVPGAAREVAEVADAVNRLTEAHREATRQRERDLALRRCTERIGRQLIGRPAEGAAWEESAALLGQELGTDEVGFYRVDDAGEQELVGGWRRDGGPARRLLSRVDGPPLAAAARASASGLLVAHDPEQIARDFPPRLAALAQEHGVQAWCLAPLLLQEEVLGMISLKQWHPSTPDVQAGQAVARVAATAALVLAERRYVQGLEDLDQQKSAFMATTSHELRTPLTSIAGYLELLEDGDFGDLTTAQVKAVAVIDRNVTRLRALIDDLLLLNRLDSGAADERRDPVDVPELVDRVRESLEPTAAAKGVTLAVRLSGRPEPLRVLGAADQLERALTNLVANAVKFTPAGGRVDIRMRRTDGPGSDPDGAWLDLQVADTGIGVPAADLDRLFTRFFRAGNAERSQTPGTGLGLVIVKTIAERHGGSVSADSVEGEGTTMTLRLPLLDAAVSPG